MAAVRGIVHAEAAISSLLSIVNRDGEGESLEVPVSRCAVKLAGGRLESDWTVSNRLRPAWGVNDLASQYACLAELCESSAYYGQWLDRWLRQQYSVPEAVESYTAQSVSGVKNWVISSVPSRVVTVLWRSV